MNTTSDWQELQRFQFRETLLFPLANTQNSSCRVRTAHWNQHPGQEGQAERAASPAVKLPTALGNVTLAAHPRSLLDFQEAIVLVPLSRPGHSIPQTARAFATSVVKSSSLEKTALIPLSKAFFSRLTH